VEEVHLRFLGNISSSRLYHQNAAVVMETAQVSDMWPQTIKKKNWRALTKVHLNGICAKWDFNALVMETASTFETLVNLYQIRRCNNPEDTHLRDVCCFHTRSWVCTWSTVLNKNAILEKYWHVPFSFPRIHLLSYNSSLSWRIRKKAEIELCQPHWEFSKISSLLPGKCPNSTLN
jgi:hypothetical protein